MPAPTIVRGPFYGPGTAAANNDMTAQVSGQTVNVGDLVVVALVVSTNAAAGEETPTLSDTLGLTYTETTTGWQSVTSGTQVFHRVSFFTAVAGSGGLNTWTVDMASVAAARSAIMLVFIVNGFNSTPLGTSGSNENLTYAGSVGATYNLTVTTGGTPANNSLMLSALSSTWNGNDAGDPSTATDDASFTNLDHKHGGFSTANGWTDVGFRVSYNQTGKNSCAWTAIPSDGSQTSAPELAVGLLLEIVAAPPPKVLPFRPPVDMAAVRRASLW